jgi:hypothetical protein
VLQYHKKGLTRAWSWKKSAKGFSKTYIFSHPANYVPPLAGSATEEWSGGTRLRGPAHSPERELGLKRNFFFGFAVTH